MDIDRDYVKFTIRSSSLSFGESRGEKDEVKLEGNCIAKKHLVGRDSKICTWVLDHESASRRHAVISIRQDKKCVTLRDNNSSHGIILNKKRLPPNVTVKLKKRDSVSFGKCKDVWVLSEIHFLSEAELAGIGETALTTFLHALRSKKTRTIMRPDEFVRVSELKCLHQEQLAGYNFEPSKFLNTARSIVKKE